MQILALILVCATVLVGQTNKGGISGSVLDQNGAAVPGATVTVTNTGTNQSVKVTTSENGAFSVSSLDPVGYRIVVEMAGFKKAIIESVKVDTASIASANITLETGAVAESVTITGDSALLNTESGVTAQTITERQIQDLPLSNRSVLDLTVTMPNVTGDAGSEDVDANSTQPVPGFNLSVNGGRPGSTAILADGVNNTGIGIARAVVSFTPETVQEFTVQSSAYSAEYGTSGGGIINVTTKSGTNSLNGTALWYTRNPATNAAPWRQGSAPRPANNLRYNQVSVSVGGPIFLPKFGEGGKVFYNGKNRSFFFFAYEPRFRTDFVTGVGLLPSAAERAGNFNGLVRTNSGFLPTAIATQFNQGSIGPATIYQQFTLSGGRLVPIALSTGFQYCQFGDPRAVLNAAGQPQCTAAVNAVPNPTLNVIPAAFIDPVSTKLIQLMDPTTGYFLDNGLVRNYVQIRSVQQNETRYTLRLDHNFSDKFRANFRYSKTPAVGIKGSGNDVNGNTGVYSDARQYLLAFNYLLSPSMVNDLRLNYTRGNFSEDFSPEFAIKTGRSLSRELGLPALTTGGLPLIFNSLDNGYVTADLGAGGSTNNFNVEQRYNISDIFYWTRGNKSWKMGVDLSDARLQVVPFFAASGGRWQFRTVQTSNNRSTSLPNGGNDIASFLLGTPNVTDFRPVLLSYYYQWRSAALFLQNDWKVKPNLTLNLGLRYSLQYPRVEKNNLQGVFRPDLAQTVTLTDAQRRATATALGVVATDPIPSYVPTTVSIPPFAFSGRGGRSRYLTPVDYKAFEPRIGFAWSPKMKLFGMDLQERSLVLRGGFGVSHIPINGNNRSANPDFGGFTTASTTATGSIATLDPTQPIRFNGNGPSQGSSTPLDTLLGTTPEGLVFLSSLGIPGIAQNPNDPSTRRVPYSENWNLAAQFELPNHLAVVEVAYVGNRGVHLYTPQVNINLRDPGFVSLIEANGLDATGTFNDPLGRTSLLGAPLTITRGSVGTPYLGFDLLNRYFDASASSIRHGAYINIVRRVGTGLSLTANYTFASSIDTASDASPDVRVLTTGSVRGQVSLGGTARGDRALSSYDVRNNFTSTFVYDLPFGSRRHFLANAPWYVKGFVGGWTVTGVIRLLGGNPFQPFITDPNHLGGAGLNRIVRPDIVSGVPLKNPLWSRSCTIGNACEPFVNPAAFMRPVKGQLGNAPRSISLRPPRQEYYDFSLSKQFPWPFASNEGKRRIDFRVDLINAFNHPNFRFTNTGNTPPGLGTFPTELTTETVAGVTQPITAAEYNTWATFNNQPLSTTTAGAAQLAAIRTTVNAVRLPPRAGQTSGALPLDFFHVQLPQGFATKDFRSFDIRSLDQFKLYRIRQNYDTNFGTLFSVNNPRYIQFGIRIFF
jgi:hypothetical protein